MPKARAETIRNLARAVCDGRINFDGIVAADDFLASLRSISGIGKWTADYVAMRALGEPDAFPSGDLGLVRALGVDSSSELERRSQTWRPWRAYATMYLWSDSAEARMSRKEVSSRDAGKSTSSLAAHAALRIAL
jgi:AraC family transcriptional regulator of adaptative response / DNA-3-methyladenine glycosylase II